MKIYTQRKFYIELTDRKDGMFSFHLSIHDGDHRLEMEEMSKNGQEDTHIYATMIPENGQWVFEDEYDSAHLNTYWEGGDYFLERVNKGLPYNAETIAMYGRAE